MLLNQPHHVLTPARQVAVLAVLWLLYTVHSMDRSILFLVVPAIQREFALSNQQVGFLSGLAYALPAALCAIPFGLLGDRRDRRAILAILVLAWSATTGASAFAAGFAILVSLRAVVGAVESGAPPIMMSVLTDTFSAFRRPLAFSFYYTGANAGVVVAGLLVHYAGKAHGWRELMMIAALPGLVLAAGLFTLVKFPAHHRDAVVQFPTTTAMTFRQVFRLPGVPLLYVLCILGGMNTMAIGAWLSLFLVRGHGVDLAQAGSIVAMAQGLGGVTGGITGGLVATRFGDGGSARLCLIAGIALCISVPCGIAAGLASAITPAIVAIAGWAFFTMMFVAPAHSALLQQVPPGMRATAAAVLIVGVQLVGAGIGPQVVAVLADLLGGSGEGPAIRFAVAIMASVALGPAVMLIRHAVRAPTGAGEAA